MEYENAQSTKQQEGDICTLMQSLYFKCIFCYFSYIIGLDINFTADTILLL
jgi:hypothetical protein